MLKIMLIFRTFYRKYAYSCYAYKKKLVYHTIAMFRKSSGFLESEPISSNSESCIV